MANPYFNAEYYLAQNPDVFAAGINTPEAAWEHYANFGAAEALNGATSRKPAPWFDVSYYLANNTDLNTAGLTAGQLFDHFTNFGIDEGRQPSAEAVLTEANLLAYAMGNEDLMEAFGIEEGATELTEEQADALAHQFYAFGYNEDRADPPFVIDEDGPGAGDTFTLTANTDFANQSTAFINGTIPSNFKFTSANETVEALAGTMNATDTLLDGSKVDNDTLNLRSGAATNFTAGVPVGAQQVMGTVQNIENITLTAANSAGDTISLATVTGAKTFTASGTYTAGGLTLGAAGASGITTYDFSGITTAGANGAVTLAMGTTVPTAALTITGGAGNDILAGGNGNDVIVGGAGNDTLSGGAGDDVLTGGAGTNTMNGGAGNDTFNATAGTNTINDLATGDVVVVSAGATVTTALGSVANFVATSDTVNNAATNAGFTINAAAGNATINVSAAGGNTGFTIVDGTGNDTIVGSSKADVINATNGGNNTITGGAGADTINITGGGNDVLIYAAGDSGLTAATADSVTGFATGTDKLKLGAAGTATNFTAPGAGVATIEAAVTAANLVFNGTVKYYFDDTGVAGGNGFFVADLDGDQQADIAITLVGGVAAPLVAADIIA